AVTCGASTATEPGSLVSSPKLAQQPRDRLLHAGAQDAAERRAWRYRRRRRYGSPAARRPGVARADGAESPWLDRRHRERAGATFLQHAANGAHDADISSAAA